MSAYARENVHALRRAADRMEASKDGMEFRRGGVARHGPADESLVVAAAMRARERDEAALRFLYLRYADVVYSAVCAVVRDEHEAEDITQALFARLSGALWNYEPRLVPFGAWIARVARNAAIDSIRSRRLVPCEEVRNAETAVDDLSRDRLEALRTALGDLPSDQREVVLLRFVFGLSPREIAERLGRSENAVHGLQHRGRRRLRRNLIDLHAAPAHAAA